MAQVTKNIVVDVSQPNYVLPITAKQGDCNSRFLVVTVQDDGATIIIPETAKVVINYARFDGKRAALFGTVNPDGTVTVPLGKSVLKYGGTASCSVTIIDEENQQKLTTTSFSITVEPAEYADGDICADDDYDVLLDLIAKAELTYDDVQEYAAAASAFADEAEISAAAAVDKSSEAADSAAAAHDSEQLADEHRRATALSESNAEQYANAAITAQEGAEAARDESRKWADGTGAEGSDPQLGNNAKHYSDLAKGHKEDAETAQGKAKEAQEAAETAQDKAEEHKDDAITAQEGAENARDAAEKWATGEDATPEDEQYENNAKYYAEKAEAARDDVSKVDISAEQIDLGASVTVTNREGVSKTVHIYSLTQVNNLYDMRNAIRLGLGPKLFPIGHEFITPHTVMGNIAHQVLGHNHHTPANPNLTHSMTLGMKHVFGSESAYKGLQYDAPEAFYFAEEGLAAGTYNFTLLAGYDPDYGGGKTYEFTLTQAVPAGGVLTFPWGYQQQAATVKVYSWAALTDTAEIESVSVAEGDGGTALGVLDGTGNLNHAQRVRYGSNNPLQNAFRQWANSTAALGSVWTPQTKFDRPPSWHTSTDPVYEGFMRGFDSDFLEVIQPAIIPYRTNGVHEVNSLDGTVQEINQVYTMTDKFFLLSRPEIYGTWDSTLYKDGEQLDYYKGLTDLERIKHDAFGTPRYAWSRSPYPSIAYDVRIVYVDGRLRTSNASNSSGGAPACIIA